MVNMITKRGSSTSIIALIVIVLIFLIASVLFVIEYSSLGNPAKTFALSSAAVLIIFSGFFIYFEFIYPPARIRRKLRKAEQFLSEESTESIKGQYKKIYTLYLKTSENTKQKYYPSIIKLREKIESQIKTEKKIEELLEKTPKLTNLKKQKHNYLKINNLYKELPAKTQHKYYQKILHLRSQLEKKH